MLSQNDITLYVGMGLVVIGVIGGGVKVKRFEIEIPPLPLPARVLSGLVGIVFIVLSKFDVLPLPNSNPVVVNCGAAITNKQIKVEDVKRILSHVKLYQGQFNNDCDDKFKKSVGEFQRAKSIEQDGLVGAQTLKKLQEAWPDYDNVARN